MKENTSEINNNYDWLCFSKKEKLKENVSQINNNNDWLIMFHIKTNL